MSALPREMPKVLAWIGVAAHVCVCLVALRRPAWSSTQRVPAALNLAIAVCIVGYWVPVWYSYIARGITWYATDQLFPTYGVAVAMLSILTLSGRFDGRVAVSLHWLIFGVDAIAFIALALYLTFARFDRLM